MWGSRGAAGADVGQGVLLWGSQWVCGAAPLLTGRPWGGRGAAGSGQTVESGVPVVTQRSHPRGEEGRGGDGDAARR